ncbi:hypothetical protein MJO28_000946 [Puccinia striiformis f. sp. tritici]|uniref:Uncharacterized protein n=1 Tax=Puccinia striiformis f. sp. tritici TaxID=168172 RepID=A0ACC0EZJ2_9BASI|nr:hypothetical protein MJO28_000946 [Puccinia striiformis f. sp. tritici]
MVSKRPRENEFDKKILDQLRLLSCIKSSQSCAQMDDPVMGLGALFNCLRPGSGVYSAEASIADANLLYLTLKNKVLSQLQAIKSKVTIIHDVWTVNKFPQARPAFLGISAGYVTDDWEYKVCHLGIKYVTWTTKGQLLAVPFANLITKAALHEKIIAQTADSGSDNEAMVEEVDELISKKTGTELNLSSNYIRSFSHQIHRIMTIGLEAIQVDPAGLVRDKRSMLGCVPILAPIGDGSGEADALDKDDLFGFEDELDSFDDDEMYDYDSSDGEIKRKGKVHDILEKVKYVMDKIKNSSTQQTAFQTWAKELKYEGPTLNDAYGDRWNINYKVWARGYQAREVINKLLQNENERQKKEGEKNFFRQKNEISENDWEVVQTFTVLFSELYSSQEKMEGEKSSACLMISEYRYLLAFIKKQKTLNKEPEFERMYEGMTEEINKSLTEALSCTPLLLATVLNPAYRLSIFEMCFPDHHAHVKSLIKDSYTKRKSELDELARSRIKSDHQPQRSELRRAHDEVDFFPDVLDSELATYIEGKYKLPSSQADQCLQWWKDHHQEFPTLSSLAKDYLSCTSDSTSLIKPSFISAGDTCRSGQDKRSLKTIERCVSAGQWLHQGIKLDGHFGAVQSHIDNLNPADLLLVDPAEFATLNRPIRNIHNQSSLLQFFH